jgi:Spy/CpxP family protein refolding chaperone
MICLAIGLGALGFCALRRAHCCGHRHQAWGPPWGHHHRRRGIYIALSHLDATPAQERAIVAELDRLHDRLHHAKSGARDMRSDLAAAVRSAVLDDAALGAALGKLDGATAEARTAVLEALRNIHALLDERQREHLAEILDRGWWRRGGGPYRM